MSEIFGITAGRLDVHRNLKVGSTSGNLTQLARRFHLVMLSHGGQALLARSSASALPRLASGVLIADRRSTEIADAVGDSWTITCSSRCCTHARSRLDSHGVAATRSTLAPMTRRAVAILAISSRPLLAKQASLTCHQAPMRKRFVLDEVPAIATHQFRRLIVEGSDSRSALDVGGVWGQRTETSPSRGLATRRAFGYRWLNCRLAASHRVCRAGGIRMRSRRRPSSGRACADCIFETLLKASEPIATPRRIAVILGCAQSFGRDVTRRPSR